MAIQDRKFFYLREPRIKREDLQPADKEPENKKEEAQSKESKVSCPDVDIFGETKMRNYSVYRWEGNPQYKEKNKTRQIEVDFTEINRTYFLRMM